MLKGRVGGSYCSVPSLMFKQKSLQILRNRPIQGQSPLGNIAPNLLIIRPDVPDSR